MTLTRLPIALAVLLAAALARRAPAHRPLAVALGGVLLLDLAREILTLPPRVDLALYLLAPALSAWCAIRVLTPACPYRALMGVFGAWWLGALSVLRAPDPVAWWDDAPRDAHLLALLVEVVAAAVWWRSPAPRGPAQACALVLAAGDAFALFGPLYIDGPWWIVAAQAAVTASGLVVIQAAALLSQRRAPPFA